MRNLLVGLVGGLCLCSSPAQAAWNEAVSRHFHIYADESPQELKAFATKPETFDTAVRVGRGTPDVAPGASTQVSVYVLPDIAAIGRLLDGDPESGIAGWYEPRASGSVAFVPQHGEVGKYRLSAIACFSTNIRTT